MCVLRPFSAHTLLVKSGYLIRFLQINSNILIKKGASTYRTDAYCGRKIMLALNTIVIHLYLLCIGAQNVPVQLYLPM